MFVTRRKPGEWVKICAPGNRPIWVKTRVQDDGGVVLCIDAHHAVTIYANSDDHQFHPDWPKDDPRVVAAAARANAIGAPVRSAAVAEESKPEKTCTRRARTETAHADQN